MNRKYILLLFPVIILSAVFLYFLVSNVPKNAKNASSVYTHKGNQVSNGFINIPSDERIARIVANLFDYESREGEIIGKFELQGERKEIVIYSKDIPTVLTTQKGTEIYSEKSSEEILDNEKKALSAFKKIKGKSVIITLLIKDFQINQNIMNCNSQFVEDLQSSAPTRCGPRIFRISLYQP